MKIYFLRNRCFVPLRVPMCTLTEHCSRAVDSTLSSAESYTCIPEGRISKLCKHLSLLALGWAVLTIVPIPTGLLRPSEGADVTLIATGFPVYPYVQYFKE